jgi:hypothetical protein
MRDKQEAHAEPDIQGVNLFSRNRRLLWEPDIAGLIFFLETGGSSGSLALLG